jgi:hypothetical protein
MTISSFSAFRAAQIHPLIFVTLFSACGARVQSAVPQQTAPAASLFASSRACSTNPVLVPGPKSKSSKKLKHPLPPEPPPVCIEIKGEAIEIQEFLQSMAREQQWRMGEGRASEDTWSFVRYFSADELEKYADTKVLIEPVEFSSGKAALTVRTTELGDGYARVQISSHFQGEGKSSDKAWAQPGNLWPLNSRGVLEQELIGYLSTRYRHLG